MQSSSLLSVTEVIDIFPLGFFQVKLNSHQWVLQPAIYGIVLLFLLLAQTVNALEKLNLNVQQIEANDWQAEDIQISLTGLTESSQQLSLVINKLSLPTPFDKLKFVNIQCLKFQWQDGLIDCQRGKAQLLAPSILSHPFHFSFTLAENTSHFSVKKLTIASGTVSIYARENNRNWSVNLKARGLSPAQIKTKLGLKIPVKISKGRANLNWKLRGKGELIKTVQLNTALKQLSLQARKGQWVSDAINLTLDIHAHYKRGVWYWQNHNVLNGGELYIAPVYLPLKKQPLTLDGWGKAKNNNEIYLEKAKFFHPGIFDIEAEGRIRAARHLDIEKLNLNVAIANLQNFYPLYIEPFTEETAFEGFKMSGRLDLDFKIKHSKIQQVSSVFSNLEVHDQNKRFAIDGAEGDLHWSEDADFLTPSNLHWKNLHLVAIPVKAGALQFLLKQQSIALLHPASIPLLDGAFNIKQFTWRHNKDDEPKVFFEGGIEHLSLDQLTQAFDWTPLSGTISGYIPGVDYENKTLTIKGDLQVKVFDGTIKINKLASSGIFTDFSRFYMDMELDNLDLYEITQKFQIGRMEGKVSGYINNLYLENWQPVTFYAWIGTPENDHSTHRISQKAVENIASIGGGGAADFISKGFLRFFDSFSYNKLGIGCYLHQGVCQLMGVEAAKQGYYLIKGGGLPRIDVIGYNPRVDWDVLLERLSRVIASDEVVIQKKSTF